MTDVFVEDGDVVCAEYNYALYYYYITRILLLLLPTYTYYCILLYIVSDVNFRHSNVDKVS